MSTVSQQTESWSSYLEGPRWAFSVSTIYDFAYRCGCRVIDVREHKGMLRKTLTFTVSGSPAGIATMKRAITLAVLQFNG